MDPGHRSAVYDLLSPKLQKKFKNLTLNIMSHSKEKTVGLRPQDTGSFIKSQEQGEGRPKL